MLGNGWLVGWLVDSTWLVDIFCLDNSWTLVPSAVELSLQIFKHTPKLTFTVTKFLLISGPSSTARGFNDVRLLNSCTFQAQINTL